MALFLKFLHQLGGSGYEWRQLRNVIIATLKVIRSECI